jgi:DNA-binding transcriptional MerR regulator
MDREFDAPFSRADSLPGMAGWPPAFPTGGAQEDLTIAEMAMESGATPRALRFYEAKGLLTPRRQGAVRLYGRAERARLALVLQAKRLGFTLGEIRRMLDDKQAEFAALPISRGQCFEQIKLLEQRKREIEIALVELRRIYSSFYVRVAQGVV